MHGADGGVMVEPEKDLGQQLRSDLQTAVDWQWLKVGPNRALCSLPKQLLWHKRLPNTCNLKPDLLCFLLPLQRVS